MEFLFRGTFHATITLPSSQILRYFRSYLQDCFDHDVRPQKDIRQLAEFDRFLGMSASLTAQEINSWQIGRKIGISPTRLGDGWICSSLPINRLSFRLTTAIRLSVLAERKRDT